MFEERSEKLLSPGAGGYPRTYVIQISECFFIKLWKEYCFQVGNWNLSLVYKQRLQYGCLND